LVSLLETWQECLAKEETTCLLGDLVRSLDHLRSKDLRSIDEIDSVHGVLRLEISEQSQKFLSEKNGDLHRSCYPCPRRFL